MKEQVHQAKAKKQFNIWIFNVFTNENYQIISPERPLLKFRQVLLFEYFVVHFTLSQSQQRFTQSSQSRIFRFILFNLCFFFFAPSLNLNPNLDLSLNLNLSSTSYLNSLKSWSASKPNKP